MSPNAGGGGCGFSADEYSCTQEKFKHAGFRIRIRINLSCWIRIRIQIPDPDPEGQKWPTKIEKSIEFPGGYFEVLDVLF
jgi:hypothetical protein